ncbi:MAG: SDR family oxidoreductase [Chloroflexi bacterium]|nr:SDR family oxidoreductase [Chloroflexota bacterium]
MIIKDRVTLITGATGGLGRVVTRVLAENGATLALLGRNQNKLDTLAAGLNLSDDNLLTHPLDAGNHKSANQAVGAVVSKFGRAEILLHFVGGWVSGQSLINTPEADVVDMLDQHLWSTYHMTQAFLPHALENRWGRLVVVSSPNATHAAKHNTPYSVGKAAQEALVLTVAQEAEGSGVTANIIHVRNIDTEHKRSKDPAKYAGWTSPEEIASAILYLCSSEGGMVNGIRLPLYGRGHP